MFENVSRRFSASLSCFFLFCSQRQFTLILQARDEASAGVIEEASYSGIVLPGPTWHTLNHQGRNAHLAYRVRVQCADHYYNATCTKFCRPRNDIFGHYTCDENGDKVCIQGWKGSDCEIGESSDSSPLCESFRSTHLILCHTDCKNF